MSKFSYKLDKTYKLSIASIVIISVSSLSLGVASLYYLITYGPLISGIPDQVDKIVIDINEFKKSISTIMEKINDIDNKITTALG